MRDTGYRVVEKEVNASHPLKANCLLSNLANVVVHQLGFFHRVRTFISDAKLPQPPCRQGGQSTQKTSVVITLPEFK